MIESYNRSQTIRAVALILGGLPCCWLAFLFFRWAPSFVCGSFGITVPGVVGNLIGLAGLAATAVSGHRLWRDRGGLFSYHESGLYHDLGMDTAGAFMMDRYLHRVTGPAYLLGQIFLSGPLWILKARSLLHSRITRTEGLEQRLRETLDMLRSVNQWKSLDQYPEHREEILYLARMRRILFSANRGEPRIRSK